MNLVVVVEAKEGEDGVKWESPRKRILMKSSVWDVALSNLFIRRHLFQ